MAEDVSIVGEEELPAYTAGRRFGRWQQWIEKRHGEAQDDRRSARTREGQGRKACSSSSNQSLHPLTTAQEEQAHFAGSSLHVTNPSPDEKCTGVSSSPALERNARSIQLTPSLALHSLGNRFVAVFPEEAQPLCARVLPLSDGDASTFVTLIGTSNGLYVLDLFPDSRDTLKRETGLDCCKIAQIWDQCEISGIEVVQASVYMVVTEKQSGSKKILIWRYEDILSLSRCALYVQNSSPVNLEKIWHAKRTRESPRRSRFLGGSIGSSDDKLQRKAISHKRRTSVLSSSRLRGSPEDLSDTNETFHHVDAHDLYGFEDTESADQPTEWTAAFEELVLPGDSTTVQGVHDLYCRSAGMRVFVVGTLDTLYLFEYGSETKKMRLKKEFALPGTGHCLDLALVDHHMPAAKVQRIGAPCEDQLSLLVDFDAKLVGIRLADAAVVEVAAVSAQAKKTSTGLGKAAAQLSRSQNSLLSKRASLRESTSRLANDSLESLKLALGSLQDRASHWSAAQLSEGSLLPTINKLLSQNKQTAAIGEPIACAQGNRNPEEHNLLQPRYTWHWRNAVNSTACFVRNTVSLKDRSASERLVVAAFHHEGFEIQEHIVLPGKHGIAAPKLAPLSDSETYGDVDGTYSIALGQKSGLLCHLPDIDIALLASDVAGSVQGKGACLMYIESIGEWKLHMLA